MNRDGVGGNEKQSRNRMKSKWGKLADDRQDGFAEERDALGSKLDGAHAAMQDEAEAEIRDFGLSRRTYRDARRP